MTNNHKIDQEDIDFVSQLIEKAGRLAFHMREGVGIKQKSGPHDLVTEADHVLSKMITEGLNARFKDDVIISEEDENHHRDRLSGNVWLIDPIDGTDNYVKNDGQYCVMIGLLKNLLPVFGWIFAPAKNVLYFGGPNFGAWRQNENQSANRYSSLQDISGQKKTRLVMGNRDRKSNPWVGDIPQLEWIVSGSIGMKVAKILDDEADVFVHLSGKLKTWDTAAPVAIALGAGLEVGSLDEDGLHFPLPNIRHETSVIIGRAGALNWSRTVLKQTS